MSTFTIDPYAGKTLPEMKKRCRELCSALSHWQMTAMFLAQRNGTGGLNAERTAEVNRLIKAYMD